MKLRQLRLRNYRGFSDFEVELHPRLNVFVGVNGSGKSSILDAIRLTFGQELRQLGHASDAELQVSRGDCREGEDALEIQALFETAFLKTEAKKHISAHWTQPGAAPTTQVPNLSGDELLDDGPDRILPAIPFFVAYGTDRAGSFVLPTSSPTRSWDRYASWENSSAPSTRFADFFEWFRQREDLENENRRDEPNARDHQLELVRQALSRVLPGYDKPRIVRPRFDASDRYVHPELVMRKGKQELAFRQLSEGERTLMALVGDIARRMALATSSSNGGRPGGTSLHGEAIVLIDEVDLHLHPAWQAQVLPRLRETFPHVQFVVTTHSPMVVASAPSECIRALSDFQLEQPDSPTSGRDANALLSELFGVSPRPEEVARRIAEVSRLIETGEVQAAKEQLDTLGKELGAHDADLVHLRTFVELMETG